MWKKFITQNLNKKICQVRYVAEADLGFSFLPIFPCNRKAIGPRGLGYSWNFTGWRPPYRCAMFRSPSEPWFRLRSEWWLDTGHPYIHRCTANRHTFVSIFERFCAIKNIVYGFFSDGFWTIFGPLVNFNFDLRQKLQYCKK